MLLTGWHEWSDSLHLQIWQLTPDFWPYYTVALLMVARFVSFPAITIPFMIFRIVGLEVIGLITKTANIR